MQRRTSDVKPSRTTFVAYELYAAPQQPPKLHQDSCIAYDCDQSMEIFLQHMVGDCAQPLPTSLFSPFAVELCALASRQAQRSADVARFPMPPFRSFLRGVVALHLSTL